MRLLRSPIVRAGAVGTTAATAGYQAMQQREAVPAGAGHRADQMRAGNVPTGRSVTGFAKNWVWDDPTHQIQDQGRQQIADATSRSDTFYGYLVARTNRALDRSGYGLPGHLARPIAQNVGDESTGKITQAQAHWNEAKGFAHHYFKEGLWRGNNEARDPIYLTGAAMNTLGAGGSAVASALARGYKADPDNNEPPWL